MYLSLSLSLYLSLSLSLSLSFFWSGHVPSSPWSNVSRVTSLWGHSGVVFSKGGSVTQSVTRSPIELSAGQLKRKLQASISLPLKQIDLPNKTSLTGWIKHPNGVFEMRVKKVARFEDLLVKNPVQWVIYQPNANGIKCRASSLAKFEIQNYKLGIEYIQHSQYSLWWKGRYIPIGSGGNISLPSEIDINSSEVGVTWGNELISKTSILFSRTQIKREASVPIFFVQSS